MIRSAVQLFPISPNTSDNIFGSWTHLLCLHVGRLEIDAESSDTSLWFRVGRSDPPELVALPEEEAHRIILAEALIKPAGKIESE